MKRETVEAVLASEDLALVSVSARTASSVVVVPTPRDRMEFRKSMRDVKARSAVKEHSNEGNSLCVHLGEETEIFF